VEQRTSRITRPIELEVQQILARLALRATIAKREQIKARGPLSSEP
jgi:hypothetical protein